jgi:hypothetical protein
MGVIMSITVLTKHSIHSVKRADFDLLNLKYPGGKYVKSDEIEWFELQIDGTGIKEIQITWFKEDE